MEKEQSESRNGFLAEIARNWLVLATMALGGAVVWGSTQATVSSLSAKISDQKAEINELRQQIATNERVANEKLGFLGRDIGDVKVSIGRVESTLAIILQQFRLGSPPPGSPLAPPGIGRQ